MNIHQPQLSLATLLLLVAAIAVWMALGRVHDQTSELQQEISEMREAVRRLDVTR